MNYIKTFERFDPYSVSGNTDTSTKTAIEIENSVKSNNFEDFKDLVADLGAGLDEERATFLKNVAIKRSADYGRVDFIKHLLSLYDYSMDEIEQTILWMNHSRAIKKGLADDPEGVIDLLNSLL